MNPAPQKFPVFSSPGRCVRGWLGLLLAVAAQAQQETAPPPASATPPPAVATEPASPPAPAAATPERTAEQLDQLLAPIALYPDVLIALILPAATVPADVTLAARFLAANGDTAAIEAQPWDDSVKALAHYPEVVKWMDENLTWTRDVGDAFADQPADVMNAVQLLRTKARAAGALVNTPQQNVVVQDQAIMIEPAQPDVIYVPRYDYDLVYGPPPFGYAGPFLTFGIGYPLGAWLVYDLNWRRRNVYWHPRDPRWVRPVGRPPVVVNPRPWHPRNDRRPAPGRGIAPHPSPRPRPLPSGPGGPPRGNDLRRHGDGARRLDGRRFVSTPPGHTGRIRHPRGWEISEREPHRPPAPANRVDRPAGPVVAPPAARPPSAAGVPRTGMPPRAGFRHHQPPGGPVVRPPRPTPAPSHPGASFRSQRNAAGPAPGRRSRPVSPPAVAPRPAAPVIRTAPAAASPGGAARERQAHRQHQR